MEIQNLQEYIDKIKEIKNGSTHEFIYRGHYDHEAYKLIPSVFRDGCSRYEFNILNDFISESSRYIKDVQIDDYVAWLELAQHYRAPTRLLDFTRNPLVALYFACKKGENDEERAKDATASVWVLDEGAYDKKYFGESILNAIYRKGLISNIASKEIFQFQRDYLPCPPQYPVIYQPVYRDERMAGQSSVFMLWGTEKVSLEKMIEHDDMRDGDQQDTTNTWLQHIEISKESKEKILHQLKIFGVDERYIYPGLDSIGKYIKEKHRKSSSISQ